MKQRLILASNSKRRHEILKKVGIHHEIIPSNFDEDLIPLHLSVDEYSVQIAEHKGAVIAQKHPNRWVLSADTSVYFDQNHLNKPKSLDEAHDMLHLLQGKSHIVATAMSLYYNGKVFSILDKSRVFFKPMNSDWIRYYHSTIDVLDAAGSYMIDGMSSLFIEKIEGTMESIQGLAIHRLGDLVEKQGGRLCDFCDYVYSPD